MASPPNNGKATWRYGTPKISECNNILVVATGKFSLIRAYVTLPAIPPTRTKAESR